MKFMPEAERSSEVLYEVIFLLIDSRKLSIEQMCDEHSRFAAERARGSIFSSVCAGAFATHILQKFGGMLSTQDNTLEVVNTPLVPQTVSKIIREQPNEWTPYLLSSSGGMDQLKSILVNQELLEAIGIQHWFAEPQPSNPPHDVTCVLPFMVCATDPLHLVYRHIISIVENQSSTIEDISGWATAQAALGEPRAWQARGLLLLAVYHGCWAKGLSCGAVGDWATLASSKNRRILEPARLNLTDREAHCFCFFARGPQVPVIAHQNIECGLAWLFSSAALNVTQTNVKYNDEVSRSSYVAALAMIIGSPSLRVYYGTPLFEPQIIAQQQTQGLGSDLGTLAKDCGYQLLDGLQFSNEGPFNNDATCRFINNALIFIAFSWNTILFDDYDTLTEHVFTYVMDEGEYYGAFDPENAPPGVAHSIYAYRRAETFLNLFRVNCTNESPNCEPALSWGCAMQATWQAMLEPRNSNFLLSRYNDENHMQQAMNCLRSSWNASFELEAEVRNAILEQLSEKLRVRLQAIEQSRLSVMKTQNKTKTPSLSTFHNFLTKNQDEVAVDGDLKPDCLRLLFELLLQKKSNLAMNVHIPAVVDMYRFAHTAFAYQMTWEEAVETRLLDAITDLPEPNRMRGLAIYNRFVAAWIKLQPHFVTYDQCNGELQQAATIPIAREHDCDLRVSNVVTNPHDEEDGCEPMRMLRQRLVKQQTDTLNLASVVSLRASEAFNRHSWLAESECQQLDMGLFPTTTSAFKLLLTMAHDDDSENDHSLFQYILAHSWWEDNPQGGEFNFDVVNIARYVFAKLIAGRPALDIGTLKASFLERSRPIEQFPEQDVSSALGMTVATRLETMRKQISQKLARNLRPLSELERRRILTTFPQRIEDWRQLLDELLAVSASIVRALERTQGQSCKLFDVVRSIGEVSVNLTSLCDVINQDINAFSALLGIAINFNPGLSFAMFLSLNIPIEPNLDTVIENVLQTKKLTKLQACESLQELANCLQEHVHQLRDAPQTTLIVSLDPFSTFSIDSVAFQVLEGLQVGNAGELMIFLRKSISMLSFDIIAKEQDVYQERIASKLTEIHCDDVALTEQQPKKPKFKVRMVNTGNKKEMSPNSVVVLLGGTTAGTATQFNYASSHNKTSALRHSNSEGIALASISPRPSTTRHTGTDDIEPGIPLINTPHTFEAGASHSNDASQNRPAGSQYRVHENSFPLIPLPVPPVETIAENKNYLDPQKPPIGDSGLAAVDIDYFDKCQILIVKKPKLCNFAPRVSEISWQQFISNSVQLSQLVDFLVSELQDDRLTPEVVVAHLVPFLRSNHVHVFLFNGGNGESQPVQTLLLVQYNALAQSGVSVPFNAGFAESQDTQTNGIIDWVDFGAVNQFDARILDCLLRTQVLSKALVIGQQQDGSDLKVDRELANELLDQHLLPVSGEKVAGRLSVPADDILEILSSFETIVLIPWRSEQTIVDSEFEQLGKTESLW
eukprot:c12678_g1_i1.p1 GENE.c12678_g1_i1~~c12678_g1_i1.p1  ORF type:complete len:1670 (-),score=303.67 c12678_g1_i1:99-4520(-)